MTDREFLDYEKRVKSLGPLVHEYPVYRLCGEDVISALAERGMLEKLTDSQVAKIVVDMQRKLVIPWSEYVDAVLDDYADLCTGNCG